jgi:uncharacterized protein with HEPN domain
MDKPTPVERIEDVLDAIANIRSFVKGVSEELFEEDSLTQSAVLFQFLIIGETIRYIDDSILEKYPYPWHIPRSFRNFIIHEYHGIKIKRIFEAVNDLDDLHKLMKLIKKNEF